MTIIGRKGPAKIQIVGFASRQQDVDYAELVLVNLEYIRFDFTNLSDGGAERVQGYPIAANRSLKALFYSTYEYLTRI
jgi:hypothetical protein